MKKNHVLLVGFAIALVILGVFAFAPDKVLKNIISSTSTPSLQDKLQAIEDKIPTQTGKNVFLKQSNNLTKAVDPELVDLDSQIITCDTNVNGLMQTGSIGGSCVGGGTTLQNTNGKNLGGQCCGAMLNTKDYHTELQSLQQYKNIPDIPLNPYKTPVTLAKKWIDYDQATTLTSDEQSMYNQAMTMSKEKGPCCCQCWHYYVNQGIAKKLIKDYHYSSKQIAEYWDNSDICG